MRCGTVANPGARSEHIFGDETVLFKVSIVFLYCR